MRKLLFIFLVLLFCASCTEKFEKSPEVPVVEAWIDAGRYPIVHLTKSLSVGQGRIDLDDLSDYLELWAKVSVSDGQDTVILSSHYSESYYPPYVYTSTYMKGEPGKTYTLNIEMLDGTKLTSQTTIAPPAQIDSLRIFPVTEVDTLRQLRAYIHTNRSSSEYYKVFVHRNSEPYGYESAYMGLVSGDMLPQNGELIIYCGRSNLEDHHQANFEIGDTVFLKIARLDETAYKYWRQYEDMILLSDNPLFPTTNNLEGNISSPGLGFWFGYGSSFHKAIIE